MARLTYRFTSEMPPVQDDASQTTRSAASSNMKMATWCRLKLLARYGIPTGIARGTATCAVSLPPRSACPAGG